MTHDEGPQRPVVAVTVPSRAAVEGPQAAAHPSPSAKPTKARKPKASSEEKADGPSKHTDRRAADYFKRRWDDKPVKRIKDVRTVGGYLRIYTDLPESADNSDSALTLCERGLEYLRDQGVADPVVFVQAEFGENGNPVLANILGPGDDNCRVTHPEPG